MEISTKELNRLCNIIRTANIKNEKIDPQIAIQLVRWIEDRRVQEDKIKHSINEMLKNFNDILLYKWF